MSRTITGATVVAGVIGAPVRHSLSPIIHNAWLEAAGVGCEVHEVPGAFHGFDKLAPKASISQAYFESKCASLRRAVVGVM